MNEKENQGSHDDGDLSDMLQELRVVQEAASLLVGFLLVASLRADFGVGKPGERWLYLATFLSAFAALVLLLAPAAHHRMERPLTDRAAFKRSASRLMLAGQALLSAALTLAAALAVSEAAGRAAGVVMAAVVGGLILALWWVVPIVRLRKRRGGDGPR